MARFKEFRENKFDNVTKSDYIDVYRMTVIEASINLGPLLACQRNAIKMAFRWGPIVARCYMRTWNQG